MPSAEADWLCLRPLSGAESDALLLDPVLEREPVRPALFDPPEVSNTATQDGAQLLSDAYTGRCAEEPGLFARSHASGSNPGPTSSCRCSCSLRLPTVRLLVADDVGIGKSIEAGLVLRELVQRF